MPWIGSILSLCVSCLWLSTCCTVSLDLPVPANALRLKTDTSGAQCPCPPIPATLGTGTFRVTGQSRFNKCMPSPSPRISWISRCSLRGPGRVTTSAGSPWSRARTTQARHWTIWRRFFMRVYWTVLHSAANNRPLEQVIGAKQFVAQRIKYYMSRFEPTNIYCGYLKIDQVWIRRFRKYSSTK
jgi:hypothetical protein